MYRTLNIELHDGILTLTLDRPKSLNAFTYEMGKELIHFYKEVRENDDVRIIIVTGAEKAFCAGMDLSLGEETFATDQSVDLFRDIGGQISMEVFQLNKPIIAAINGPAVGIGLTMTLPMDIRIVKKDTKLGFVFGRVGIGPEAASGWFLPKIVGIGQALEWMLTGRYISTSEALSSGLVQYESENPLDKAYRIANDIIENTSATSNHFTRKLIWNMTGENHPYESHLLESKFLHWAGSKADAIEGIHSFLEKRTPNFRLRASDVPPLFEQNETEET